MNRQDAKAAWRNKVKNNNCKKILNTRFYFIFLSHGGRLDFLGGLGALAVNKGVA